MPKSPFSIFVQTRITPTDAKRLAQLAEKEGITVAALIRRLIMHHVAVGVASVLER